MSNVSKKNELRHVYMANNKLVFTINLLLRLTLGFGNLLLSYLLMLVIDMAVSGEREGLIGTVYISIVTEIVYIIAYYFMRYSFSTFLKRGSLQYKNTVFKMILDKNIRAVENSRALYLSAITNDLTLMETTYYEKVFISINSLVIFVMSLAVMFYNNVLLTIISIALMLLPLIVSILTGNKLAMNEKKVSQKNEEFVSVLKDLLDGFSILKTYRVEKNAYDQFDNANRAVEDAKYNRRILAKLIDLLSDFAGTIAQFGLFLIGAFFVVDSQEVTVGMLALFLQLMNYILAPLNVIPNVISAKKSVDVLTEKLSKALDSEDSDESKIKIGKLKNNIRFDDVTFSYDENKNVLQNVSLNFEKGKSYALVGMSGCGKSTILNLIMGINPDYSGKITYDDVEIKDIDLESIYKNISLVQQKVFMFNDTIKNNITLYRNVSDKDLNDAIDKSGLRGLVDSKGLDYLCGEGGINLSGGEQQRIAIARSLLSNTEVILFDEATSALDNTTGNMIMKTILAMKSTTRIMVTHQYQREILSEIDEIIVLKNGVIIESGSFEELLDKKGYFYSLYTIGD
ncbi:MAG: ABC transporter ATP-binding protein [Butyrivibrio sp.]|jgi:ABC-type bacteriocin/lantibiotic exporter with double-glycine peptidase domain|nr:ABC transporter ATP-binding protein [Butyrivibrio sp.]